MASHEPKPPKKKKEVSTSELVPASIGVAAGSVVESEDEGLYDRLNSLLCWYLQDT